MAATGAVKLELLIAEQLALHARPHGRRSHRQNAGTVAFGVMLTRIIRGPVDRPNFPHSWGVKPSGSCSSMSSFCEKSTGEKCHAFLSVDCSVLDLSLLRTYE